jgi:ATP-dependent Clp protease ATP-binding subunit ClpB
MGNPELYPEHLVLALLDQELPQQLVPDAAELRLQAEAALSTKPSVQGMQQQPNVSAAFSRVLDEAADEAKRLEDDYVSTEHLLLALDVVPRDQLEEKIKAVRGGQRVTSQDPEETYQALEKFGRDLTAAAEEGKLDPVIGRDEEVRRVIQVLSRRTKNNPVLIGDPGWARRRSSKDWRSALSPVTSRRASRASASGRSTSARSSPARSTAASSRSG